ncbi:murein hydrolase activator EnvC family protein [Leifsonia sp. Leaf264]|uniref:murein hydrolase activator EnvC family protein n=1 Tax=Leifsonia sp. Leaf264 TaxID=1736314 RepID=UPI0006F2225E|nr:peptidoglycan DD-metalloendopeptidase family protein [Leifsonia sp. Leaf264]KQP01291.1 hypothetical protein ASF30_01295 [Leifsonia sp. Leaf264]
MGPRSARRIRLLVLIALLAPIGLAAAPAASEDPAPRGDWRWPLTPPVEIVAEFVAPATRYSAGHRGIDLATASGTAVLAPTDAVVSFVGVVVDRPLITLAYGDGVLVSLEPVLASVGEGDQVERGQVIGTAASGGHCGDGCLHLGVRVHGEYISPLAYITGLPRAVLLPLGR